MSGFRGFVDIWQAGWRSWGGLVANIADMVGRLLRVKAMRSMCAVRAGVVFDLDLDVIDRVPAYFDLPRSVANIAVTHHTTPANFPSGQFAQCAASAWAWAAAWAASRVGKNPQ